MDSKQKKVSVVEVFIRLFLILTPIVGPYIMDVSGKGKIIIPIIWLVILGPVFLIPFGGIDNYEDDAKPYYWIFQSIGKLYLFLFFLMIPLYMFFGQVRF